MKGIKRIIWIIILAIPLFIIAYGIIQLLYNNASIDKDTGKYSEVKLFEQDVADKYVDKIIKLFEEENYDRLIPLIDRDNINFAALSNLSIKDRFEDMDIIGKDLEKTNYSTRFRAGVNNVFSYTLLNKENSRSYNINIIEYSPNIFVFNIMEIEI